MHLQITGRAAFATVLLALQLELTPVAGFATASDRPSPPAQPAQGPGGAERPYPDVEATSFGELPTGYWLFEPVDASGAMPAEPLPLVIFLHGFLAVDPSFYRAWIEHIARGGAVVIFPFYQTLDPLTLRPGEYLANVDTAIADALAELEQPGHSSIDRSRVAVVGHSVGGVLAVNYAATAAANGLPVPSVIMPVEPGGCEGCTSGMIGQFGIALEDLSSLDSMTRAIVVAGEDDRIVGTEPAKLIWESMSSLQPGHRDYVLIHSDDHGRPALDANHLMPLTGVVGSADALDWYGPWKLFDALTACAFAGSDCDRALGGTSFQQDMGTWSDGTPVTPAVVESA